MKRRALGLLLFLLIIPLFMGCDQTTEATTTKATTTEEMTTVEVSLGTVTFEIYTAGDNSETTEVETEYVSNTMEVAYYEDDTLFELLNTNFTMTYEEYDSGHMLTSIDTLVPIGNEWVRLYVDYNFEDMWPYGVDDTELVDGSVYQFKLDTF